MDTVTLQPRIDNPAFAVPGAMDALQALGTAVHRAGVPARTLELMHLRASQINTRVADRADPVPDGVWDEAARHDDEAQLAALVMAIASVNMWNRLNVATRQVAGQGW
jgi:alkylhydroperoxidase family enzyme